MDFPRLPLGGTIGINSVAGVQSHLRSVFDDRRILQLDDRKQPAGGSQSGIPLRRSGAWLRRGTY